MCFTPYIKEGHLRISAGVFLFQRIHVPYRGGFFRHFSTFLPLCFSGVSPHTCPHAHSSRFLFFRVTNFGVCATGHTKKVSQQKQHTLLEKGNGYPHFGIAVLHIQLFFNKFYDRRYVIQGVGMMCAFGLYNHL